jgi:hypothetical protein
MIAKRAIAVVGGLVLILAATYGLALSQGFRHGGKGGGGHDMFLLARAAGLTHEQISTAFQSDTTLKNDFANLKIARQAMMSCMLAGNCTNQVASFASAQQALVQERMTVWQKLFQGAGPTNLQQAASVYSQLQQLQSQKKQIFQSVFGSSSSDSAGTTSPNG